jgi:retron-type reverse transcriptase
MDLLHKALKTGYIDLKGTWYQHKVGTYQGSLISPILCNIYLHQLDEYMEIIQKEFNIGKGRIQNPVYTALTRNSTPEKRNLIRDKKIRAKLGNDPSFKKLIYVRYADEFLIGVIGSKKDCEDILTKVNNFLTKNLNLQMSDEKTKITHAITERARFLGTDIRITPDDKQPYKKVNYKGKGMKTVKGTTRPQLLAPIKEIVMKLKEKGIVTHEGSPTRVGK